MGMPHGRVKTWTYEHANDKWNRLGDIKEIWEKKVSVKQEKAVLFYLAGLVW